MTILDTSVWVAFINRADSQHAQALSVLNTVALPVVVPEYILVETCSVLTVKVSKVAAVNWLNFVSDNQNCTLLFSEATWAKEMITFFKTKAPRTLSFPDAALLQLAQEYTILTFDKQLARAIKKNST